MMLRMIYPNSNDGHSKPHPIRKVTEQLTELVHRIGKKKKDVADDLGVEPAYLAQLMARGMDMRRIEQVAKSVRVKPYVFDRYVQLALTDWADGQKQVLDVLRVVIFEMRQKERDQWAEVAMQLAHSIIDGRDKVKSHSR